MLDQKAKSWLGNFLTLKSASAAACSVSNKLDMHCWQPHQYQFDKVNSTKFQEKGLWRWSTSSYGIIIVKFWKQIGFYGECSDRSFFIFFWSVLTNRLRLTIDFGELIYKTVSLNGSSLEALAAASCPFTTAVFSKASWVAILLKKYFHHLHSWSLACSLESLYQRCTNFSKKLLCNTKYVGTPFKKRMCTVVFQCRGNRLRSIRVKSTVWAQTITVMPKH